MLVLSFDTNPRGRIIANTKVAVSINEITQLYPYHQRKTYSEQSGHKSSTKKQVILGDFPIAMTDTITSSMRVHENMAQVFSEDKIKYGFARLLLDTVYKDLESD